MPTVFSAGTFLPFCFLCFECPCHFGVGQWSTRSCASTPGLKKKCEAINSVLPLLLLLLPKCMGKN